MGGRPSAKIEGYIFRQHLLPPLQGEGWGEVITAEGWGEVITAEGWGEVIPDEEWGEIIQCKLASPNLLNWQWFCYFCFSHYNPAKKKLWKQP